MVIVYFNKVFGIARLAKSSRGRDCIQGKVPRGSLAALLKLTTILFTDRLERSVPGLIAWAVTIRRFSSLLEA